ncbi:MAG: bifunctional diaminohydroxyphosphoribosylaminopyrimidine deaminase/5-amino-6-(5-phosphoribosylamino)uracil reductase RibD [Candidatus Pelagibacter sp.]
MISTGVTSKNGRPHAEYNAIKNCIINPYGSTAYITMEPCTHKGKTNPCSSLLIKSKVKKVIYSVMDIDHRTSNHAYKVLKKKGIIVKKGILKKEIDKFYLSYKFNRKYKLPYVTGKIACSKDNYIKSKKLKYISDETSLNVGHLLRYKNDGILVSYKTLNDDNPKLDCRLNGLQKNSPKIFIIDKNLKIKNSSYVVNSINRRNTYIFYNSSKIGKIKYLKKKNVKLIKIPLETNNQLNLTNVLKIIYKKKIFNLLVEGGRSLTRSFLNQYLFNQFYLFKSDKFLKSSGLISISDILIKLDKNFKSKKVLDTYTNKDKIIRFI